MEKGKFLICGAFRSGLIGLVEKNIAKRNEKNVRSST
jgi:hypothetical protein